MRRIVLVVAFTAVLVFSAFGQVRLDLGFDVPMTVGAISGSGVTTSSEFGTFLREHPLPFPEASLYYQFEAGPVRFAPGVRFFTFILESVLWPNLIAELQVGPMFFEGQIGGLLFAVFGLYNNVDFGAVLIPDLSVWVGLGKERQFRLGGGVLGLVLPELTTEGMLIIPYLGAKAVLTF